MVLHDEGGYVPLSRQLAPHAEGSRREAVLAPDREGMEEEFGKEDEYAKGVKSL
jgi:hypothetical protein